MQLVPAGAVQCTNPAGSFHPIRLKLDAIYCPMISQLPLTNPGFLVNPKFTHFIARLFLKDLTDAERLTSDICSYNEDINDTKCKTQMVNLIFICSLTNQNYLEEGTKIYNSFTFIPISRMSLLKM